MSLDKRSYDMRSTFGFNIYRSIYERFICVPTYIMLPCVPHELYDFHSKTQGCVPSLIDIIYVVNEIKVNNHSSALKNVYRIIIFYNYYIAVHIHPLIYR